jgi:hypothetical protein
MDAEIIEEKKRKKAENQRICKTGRKKHTKGKKQMRTKYIELYNMEHK